MPRRRRGRERRRLARASGPPINPEHANWIVSSVGQARKRQQEYRRFKDNGTPGQRQFDEVSVSYAGIAVQTVTRFTRAV